MIPTIVNNPVDNLKINQPPELTTAVINQYYPQLNQNWEASSQQCTVDGVPYSRTYSVLSFPYTETRLTKIDLGSYDPEYGADFYYLVINYFLETLYSSSINQTVEVPFSKWNKIETKFRQEATYFHKKISELIWERPTIGLAESSQYIFLEEDYTLTINVGKALSTVISSISPIEVRLKNSVEEEGEIVNSNFILLTKPILEIKLKNITSISHSLITINFYGEYQWSSQVPVVLGDEDELMLLHPYQTEYTTRLTPPGLPNLPSNFWNSNLNNIAIVDLTSRTGNAQWI